eukprot:scaffold149_cov315-Pinguiococcus_pyrenoidosus.AAC.58
MPHEKGSAGHLPFSGAHPRAGFDKKYGRGWNCVVGRSFGGYVTHEIKTYMYFTVVPSLFLVDPFAWAHVLDVEGASGLHRVDPGDQIWSRLSNCTKDTKPFLAVGKSAEGLGLGRLSRNRRVSIQQAGNLGAELWALLRNHLELPPPLLACFLDSLQPLPALLERRVDVALRLLEAGLDPEDRCLLLSKRQLRAHETIHGSWQIGPSLQHNLRDRICEVCGVLAFEDSLDMLKQRKVRRPFSLRRGLESSSWCGAHDLLNAISRGEACAFLRHGHVRTPLEQVLGDDAIARGKAQLGGVNAHAPSQGGNGILLHEAILRQARAFCGFLQHDELLSPLRKRRREALEALGTLLGLFARLTSSSSMRLCCRSSCRSSASRI